MGTSEEYWRGAEQLRQAMFRRQLERLVTDQDAIVITPVEVVDVVDLAIAAPRRRRCRSRIECRIVLEDEGAAQQGVDADRHADLRRQLGAACNSQPVGQTDDLDGGEVRMAPPERRRQANQGATCAQ